MKEKEEMKNVVKRVEEEDLLVKIEIEGIIELKSGNSEINY